MKERFNFLPSLLIVLSLLSGCNGVPATEENDQEVDTLKTSSLGKMPIDTSTLVINVDSSDLALPDTLLSPVAIKEAEPGKRIKAVDTSGLPILVIENMAALWPEAYCTTSQFNEDSLYFEEAKKLFQKSDLISLGYNGVQDQKIEKAYCMRGECGGSQVAIKLKNEEPFGILTTKDFQSAAMEFNFMSNRSEKEMTLDLRDSVYNFMDSSYHVSKDSQFYIQIGGTGFIQENQWPMFDKMTWRLIQIKGNQQEISVWNKFDLRSTNLPKPIGIITDEDRLDVIWYHGQGLCCPSFSKAWITQVRFLENGKLDLLDSKMYKGGIGQPCD